MTLKEKLELIGGCGDSSCHVYVRGGMVTNGGCRCFARNDGIKAQRIVNAYRTEVDNLRGQLAELAEIGRELANAAKIMVLDYDLLNPIRTANVHQTHCCCRRCVRDNAEAVLARFHAEEDKNGQ